MEPSWGILSENRIWNIKLIQCVHNRTDFSVLQKKRNHICACQLHWLVALLQESNYPNNWSYIAQSQTFLRGNMKQFFPAYKITVDCCTLDNLGKDIMFINTPGITILEKLQKVVFLKPAIWFYKFYWCRNR